MAELPDEPTRSMLQSTVQEGLPKPHPCRIMVLGVGVAGIDTVARLAETGMTGAECVAIGTDPQNLNASNVAQRLLIGPKTTRGLQRGDDPKIGRAAAEESRDLIANLLDEVDVLFMAVGLHGDTGAGAAPVIAEIGRCKGAIVVGVATTPSTINKGRTNYVTAALNDMRRSCDTVIIIDNNKLREAVPQLSMDESSSVADRVSANVIKDLVETISAPSLINLDFADFKAIVEKGDVAVVGMGESEAPNRADEAVQNALTNSSFDVDLAGASGALVHVCGDNQMTIEEANRVGEIITEMMGSNTLVTWGARVNRDGRGPLKVTLLMTGVPSPYTSREFGSIMPQLYDIESSYAEPEKALSIDFGLDQIESLEE